MDRTEITVFLNGHLTQSCKIRIRPHMSVKDILSESSEKFNLHLKRSFKIFDSTGGEISDEDLDMLNPDEPLFLSRGEAFLRQSSMAIYEELKKLGQGGFGSVSLYKNKLTKEEVAIKVVSYKTLVSHEDVSRVYTEMMLLRSLKHQNIVKLIDAFPLDDKLCFVMEYCSGGELQKYVEEKGKLDEEEVFSLAVQIIGAVRYCHNNKVIHRDLKLENVLFSNRNKNVIKIVDFGIAGMCSASGKGQKSDSGSLMYTAPEVISRTDNRASPALDIWSLGCIFYALLTGSLPFQGNTVAQIVQNIVNVNYAPLPASVSNYWRHLITNIFQKNPEKRWSMLKISNYIDKCRYGSRDLSISSNEEEIPVIKKEESKKSIANQRIIIRDELPGRTILTGNGNRCSQIKKRTLIDSEKISSRNKSPERQKILQLKEVLSARKSRGFTVIAKSSSDAILKKNLYPLRIEKKKTCLNLK
ncbi:unnamed protein product [Blepharisma stoltei]|uniref:Protein kinase domain-containing protein n=1 Tax=Blepharisma stoltei TaxID=1481888 RepID=A0AAU9KKY8_9CILI|nr:unnamed protein product [Blepharisma stoltei]